MLSNYDHVRKGFMKIGGRWMCFIDDSECPKPKYATSEWCTFQCPYWQEACKPVREAEDARRKRVIEEWQHERDEMERLRLLDEQKTLIEKKKRMKKLMI